MSGSEWYGGWVRGIGGCTGIFREISEKFPGKFGEISGEISGEIYGDPKTGKGYCITAKQNLDKRLSRK